VTTPSDRLDRVLVQLGKAIDGKRRLPVLQGEDAEVVCGLFHEQVDRGTEARARAVEAAGHTVACHDGCSQCCRSLPQVFAGEAITIARWLDRPEQAEARAGFVERYPTWRAALEDLLVRYDEALAAGDSAAAQQVSREVWRRQVMCAFNQDGRCTVYAVRPNVCRNAHALDRVCDPTTGDELQVFAFAPLDEYLAHLQPMVMALHRALRHDDSRRQPLCVAVHDYLGSK
jgi:hypothetical protein